MLPTISRAPRSRPASVSGTRHAGFDISQTLIEYSAQSGTYGRAFWVGLLNTLLVASIGIVLATVVGFVVGIARLSRNWLIGKLAAGYVELIRNVPLLLQLLFWYNAVLKALPDLRDSWTVFGNVYLNNRGFFAPSPIFQDGIGLVVGAFVDRRGRRDRVIASGRASGRNAPASSRRSDWSRLG